MTPALSILNWKTSPEFLHFLQFDFDFNFASTEAKRQVMTLLPLAVGDNRMTGAISNTVLKEALLVWNRPVDSHAFIRDSGRWRYIGTNIRPSQSLAIIWRKGKLRRSISVGSFCKSPVFEVIS